jgi:hypothetical protein
MVRGDDYEPEVSTADGGINSLSWNTLVVCVSTGSANELAKLGVKEVTKVQLQSKRSTLYFTSWL